MIVEWVTTTLVGGGGGGAGDGGGGGGGYLHFPLSFVLQFVSRVDSAVCEVNEEGPEGVVSVTAEIREASDCCEL